MIYADNAATTKLDIDAFEAMKPFLLEEYGNASQPYSFASSAKRALKKARETIANYIGAFPDEIYFTSGGTESNNWAIKKGANTKGQIITSQIEHHAVLNSCRALELDGRKIVYLPVNRTGCVEKGDLIRVLDKNTSLVSIMFANNEVGSIQEIKELASIAHKYGALFHTDAVQAVGHVEIDVHELNIDFLSASAHKFNGPKGVGFLYVKRGNLIKSYMDGGTQELERRAGTENVAAIVGMAIALKNNCNNITSNRARILELENLLVKNLSEQKINYIRNGADNHLPGIINLSFKGISGEQILHYLDMHHICISTGAACNGRKDVVSHVLQAIGVQDKYIHGTIRISLGKENTELDVVNIVKEITSCIKKLSITEGE